MPMRDVAEDDDRTKLSQEHPSSHPDMTPRVNGQPAREEDEDEDCLTFRESRQTKKVKIYNEETGRAKKYLLVEMMSDGVEEWTKFEFTRLTGGKARRGRPDPKDANFKDYAATLISMCLCEEDGKTPVPKSVIRDWPASTINGLFDVCQTMNGLNEEGRDQAKKA